MGEKRKNIFISSSIENWKSKIDKKLIGYNGKRTLFFGAYHEKDYNRIINTEGPKSIYWQGSDILQLPDTIAISLTYLDIKHYCENEVCRLSLEKKGINAEIKYIFWGDAEKYIPQAWTCMHEKREIEYGIEEIRKMSKDLIVHVYGIKKENEKNIIYHGKVSEEQLDNEIRSYQIAIRLNKFDGMSEVVSKGILLGQKVISTIQYPDKDREFYLKEFNKKIWT